MKPIPLTNDSTEYRQAECNVRPARLDLNPSSAERWTTCTASPGFIFLNSDKLPPSGSKFSEEGTTAHEVASALLLGREPRLSECPTPIDDDMRWHSWNYMEHVLSLKDRPDSQVLVEQKMPLWYMPGRNAIVDAAVLNEKSLHVVDLKYGSGVPVSPENNLQATIYAYNIAEKMSLPDSFPITIHIYQPRGRNADSPALTWETTWAEIKLLALDISLAASLIQDVAAGKRSADLLAFRPSEKGCQWCPAKGFCTARQNRFTADVDAFEVLTVPEAKLPLATALTPDQIAAVLTHQKEIVRWMKDVEDYALTAMTAGTNIPGFKRVMSRGGNRYWTDPAQAAKLLTEHTLLRREEVVEEKTITPAAVEKLLGKGKLPLEVDALIAKPPGVPEIAPEWDKREAIGNVVDEFEVLKP